MHAESGSRAQDSGLRDLPNRWNRVILLLVAVALVVGLGLSFLPTGPLRDASFWLELAIAALMIVSAIGWAYIETRNQERLSELKSNRERILSYLGALVVVAALAVAATLVPPQLGRVMWKFFVPIWLVAGWWFRRRARLTRLGRVGGRR